MVVISANLLHTNVLKNPSENDVIQLQHRWRILGDFICKLDGHLHGISLGPVKVDLRFHFGKALWQIQNHAVERVHLSIYLTLALKKTNTNAFLLHLWIEDHVVLVDSKIRLAFQFEVVGNQLDGCSMGSLLVNNVRWFSSNIVWDVSGKARWSLLSISRCSLHRRSLFFLNAHPRHGLGWRCNRLLLLFHALFLWILVNTGEVCTNGTEISRHLGSTTMTLSTIFANLK